MSFDLKNAMFASVGKYNRDQGKHAHMVSHLEKLWGPTIRTATTITVGPQTNFKNLLEQGFVIPLQEFLTDQLGPLVWQIRPLEDYFGVSGEALSGSGLYFEVYITGKEFRTITLRFLGENQSRKEIRMPFRWEQPLSRIFLLIGDKLKILWFEEDTTSG